MWRGENVKNEFENLIKLNAIKIKNTELRT